jgi:hypothetical protein
MSENINIQSIDIFSHKSILGEKVNENSKSKDTNLFDDHVTIDFGSIAHGTNGVSRSRYSLEQLAPRLDERRGKSGFGPRN